MSDRLSAIPNSFYDLIVFVTPSVILAFGILIGLDGFAWTRSVRISEIGAINLVGILIAGLIASYEFGRIAEAWSAIVVQKPLAFLTKHTRLFQNPDFLASHADIHQYLGLASSADARQGDKWVIYLYSFIANPGLGGDLLKRYAWEKLSRSSAFTYALLSVTTAVFFLGHLLFSRPLPAGALGFGGYYYSPIVAVLMMVTYVEYYKRNSWNYDLLVKTTPVLMEALRLQREQLDSTLNVNLHFPQGRRGR